MTKTINAKGNIIFAYKDKEIQYVKRDRDYFLKYFDNKEEFVNLKYHHEFTMEVEDIMSGEEFLSHVKDKTIINYDGYIKYVFVDGFVSNLGLIYDNFIDGKFLVDENAWLEICNEFDVLVEWVNK